MGNPAEHGRTFDNTRNDWGMNSLAEWKRGLPNPPEREYQIRHDTLFSTIGAFGTVGGSIWRQKMDTLFAMISDDLGISYDADEVVYNPVITARPWTAKDAVEESRHLLSDAVKIHGIERRFSSIGSLAELGFLASASLLKGSKLISFINEPELEMDESVERAKSLSIIDMKHVAKMVPKHVIMYPSLKSAAERAWEERAQFIDLIASPVRTESLERIIPREGEAKPIPQVILSGSNKDPNSRERQYLIATFDQQEIPYVDTHRDDWNLDIYEKEELPLKDNSLVNTVIITDTRSFGAVKDVGLALFRAITRGSYAIIYFPPDNEDPKSEYGRARALAMSHFKGLATEFPWIKHYVRFASSIEDAGQYSQAIISSQS